MTLDLQLIRSQFPALKKDAVFLDNPAGTQVAQQVLNRMNQYLIEMNANQGGAFATSQDLDALINETRGACVQIFWGLAAPMKLFLAPI